MTMSEAPRTQVKFLDAIRAPELWLLLMTFTAATLFSLSDNLSYTPDSARYIIWAQSLAQGNGFSDWTSPEPLRYVVHAPLYPIFLSPVAFLFGPSVEAMKAATIFMGVSFALLVYALLRRWIGRLPSGVALAVILVNPLTIHFSTQVLSEMLFALFFVGTLYAVEWRRENPSAGSRSLIVIIVLVAGCILSREIGMVIVPVVAGLLLLDQRYEDTGWLFIGVALVFGGWYLRNEVIIAGREQPELRNALLFVSNVLTSRDHSLMQELLTRSAVNIQFYGQEIFALIFFPQFDPVGSITNTLYAVVNRDSQVLRFAQMVVTPIYHAMSFGSLIVAGFGAFRSFRTGTLWALPAGFLLLYGTMILLYPVSDLRFLYPVFIVLTIWFAAGIGEMQYRAPKFRSVLWLMPIGAALLPNLLWGLAFVNEARMYASDPILYYRNEAEGTTRSNEYLRPFPTAAQWIRDHTDPSDVVLCRWKELGIALPEKKVLVHDVFSSLDRFEQAIREYGITTIVMTRDAIGWHEFETQMARSKHYSFRLVHAVAAIDIYRVEPVTSASPKIVETRPMFSYLLYHVEQGNYDSLRSFYRRNRAVSDAHPYLRFFEGVMHELSGSYDTARTIFTSLYGIPQGIVLSQQIGFHQKLIAQRIAAEQSADRTERAALLFNLALNYWELDFRNETFRFLNATIREDESYLPAYNLFVHCALMNRDTAAAMAAFDMMKSKFPEEPATAAFSTLFSHFRALSTAPAGPERAGHWYHVSETYRSLGLSENSIEALSHAVREDGHNPVSAERLASLWVGKRRIKPAVDLLHKALHRHPQSEKLTLMISELESRY